MRRIVFVGLAAFLVMLAVAGEAMATVETVDSDGQTKQVFSVDEPVYLEATGLTPNTEYCVWIQSSMPGNGQPFNFSDDPSGGQESFTTDESGNGNYVGVLEIWSSATTEGGWYVVLDSGCNEKYDSGSDPGTSFWVGENPPPVPELPTFVLLLGGLAGISLLGRRWQK